MLKRIIGLTVSLVSLLGINFIPLELLLNRGFSSSGAMLLYLAENVTAILISTAIVYVLGSRKKIPTKTAPSKTADRKAKQAFANFSPLNAQLLNFLVPALITTVATSFFLLYLVFLILKVHITATLFWYSIVWIVGFQALEFTGTLIMIYPLNLKRSESFLNRTLGRVILLLLCVLFGVFCAVWISEWFVIPFVVLKTIVDIGEQFQIFRDIGKTAYVLTS